MREEGEPQMPQMGADGEWRKKNELLFCIDETSLTLLSQTYHTKITLKRRFYGFIQNGLAIVD